ncbi:MAG TPA: hypothetical protein PKZ76_17585 [Xanthomonadaceae bacterium]|nr:hypothetical protein [Xanthomonadaceae bacterium]
MSLMNKAMARELGDQAVKVLNESLGPDWRAKKEGGKFDPAVGSLTVRITLERASAEAAAARDELTRSEWNLYAARLGLPCDAIGASFRYGALTYRVVSLSPNRPKYPVTAECITDGMQFKFPADIVAAALQRNTPEPHGKAAAQ